MAKQPDRLKKAKKAGKIQQAKHAKTKQAKKKTIVNRRKYSRVDTSVKVRIQKYNKEDKTFITDAGMSKNVSAGGLLLAYDKLLQLGSFVMVSFTLPGSTDEELDFVGKIVRVELMPDGIYEYGIMFMRKTPGEYEKLHQYVFDAL